MTTPPTYPLESWAKQEFGYLSEEVIFISWQNKNGWRHSLDLFNIREGSAMKSIDLTEFSWDIRLGFASNGRQLLALNREKRKNWTRCEVIDSFGMVGYLGLGGWDSHNCLDIYADPATMVGYVRNKGKYGLMVWDFV